MKRQMKNTIQKTMTTRHITRQLKSALVWMLMLAMVWNSTVIQAAETSSRDRRSENFY